MSNEDSYFLKDNMVYEGTTTDRVGCSCGSLVTFFIIGFVLIVIIGFLFLVVSSYNSWLEGFLIERDGEYVVYIEDILLEERDRIEKLIQDFSESEQEVDFVEFTPYEAGVLMSDAIARALPDGIMLEQVYIEPFERKWTIYIKTYTENISLPWLAFEVRKADLETAELEITGVYVGDINTEILGFSYLTDNINEGYKKALILVNDNGITGRKLENIELGSDVIVIKGSLRDEEEAINKLQIPVRGR